MGRLCAKPATLLLPGSFTEPHHASQIHHACHSAFRTSYLPFSSMLRSHSVHAISRYLYGGRGAPPSRPRNPQPSTCVIPNLRDLCARTCKVQSVCSARESTRRPQEKTHETHRKITETHANFFRWGSSFASFVTRVRASARSTPRPALIRGHALSARADAVRWGIVFSGSSETNEQLRNV